MRHASIAMSCVAEATPTNNASAATMPRLAPGSVADISNSPIAIGACVGQNSRSVWSKPRGEPWQPNTVNERRPQELDRIDDRDKADEADGLERHTDIPQPERQSGENQDRRKACRKAERQHGERTPVGDCREEPATTVRKWGGFSNAAHIGRCVWGGASLFY